MTNRELKELLVKVDDIRRSASLTSDVMDSVAKLIKDELDHTKAQQSGPEIGQTYWFAQVDYADSYAYNASRFDLDICKYASIYPEERFAEAELRAKELIQSVNKRRRELNAGKESGERKFYIVYRSVSGLDVWGESNQSHNPGFSYPFGLFKDIADCKTCISEFEGELEWFFKEYLPLIAELDEYDWSEAL